MVGVLAISSRRARIAWLAGATALSCTLAVSLLPATVAAQSIDLEQTVSPDAEMLLEADTIVYDNDRNTITAVGGVQIEYDGNRLVAQRVTYDRATSRLIARMNFLRFSAWRRCSEESSSLESLVTPSTNSPISEPNSSSISLRVTGVSSITSCSRAVTMVAVSSR